jgi:transcriptional regulator of acetoin/glycerol metabolism
MGRRRADEALAAPRWSPEGLRRIQLAREHLLCGAPEASWPAEPLVRPEIATSWRRSVMLGIDPSRRGALPYEPDREPTPRLLRAAEPVLDRLVQQLSGTPTGVVLADSKAWVLWRGAGKRSLFAALDAISASPGCWLGEEVVGTNGLGTVVEERRATMIVGGEHYLDSMQDFTCVGVPIMDPHSNRLEGVLDLTCPSRATNELLLPLLAEAVREIEQRLREHASVRERALFDEFIKQTRRGSQAVASLSGDFLITNAAAAQLFEPADHALLWDWAGHAVSTGRDMHGEVRLTREIVVQARCTPVPDGTGTAGVVITMVPKREPPGALGGGHGRAVVSRTWQRVLRQVERVASMPGPVLLRGERGVGKIHLARRLHDVRASGGPLVLLDCRAYEGRSASWLTDLRDALGSVGGTVVLHHIHELPEPLAAAATGLIGARPAQVVLTEIATGPGRLGWRGLHDVVEATIDVPPLRDHLEDVPELVTQFIAELSGDHAPPRCTAQVFSTLGRQRWSGNVRELRRVVATAVATCMGFDLTVHDLPPEYRQPASQRSPALLETSERDAIVSALHQAGWNKDLAAAALGISRATIYRRIKRFGIAVPAVAQ